MLKFQNIAKILFLKIKNYKSRWRYWLAFLFISSLTFCLWLGDVPLTTKPLQLGLVRAQSPDASQLVQQGLESYQTGDLKAAIERWEKALNIYQQNKNAATEAIVRENLALVYHEIGQSEQAVIQWQQVIAYYRQVGNLQRVGRSLTELA